MDDFDDNIVKFSEFLSGILLFKSYISNNELLNLISNYENEFDTEIIDNDLGYLYDYITIYNEGIGILNNMFYNSTIRINNKCMTFRSYLLSSTNEDIIGYLEGVFNSKLMLLNGDIKSLSINTKKVKKKIFGLI